MFVHDVSMSFPECQFHWSRDLAQGGCVEKLGWAIKISNDSNNHNHHLLSAQHSYSKSFMCIPFILISALCIYTNIKDDSNYCYVVLTLFQALG